MTEPIRQVAGVRAEDNGGQKACSHLHQRCCAEVGTRQPSERGRHSVRPFARLRWYDVPMSKPSRPRAPAAVGSAAVSRPLRSRTARQPLGSEHLRSEPAVAFRVYWPLLRCAWRRLSSRACMRSTAGWGAGGSVQSWPSIFAVTTGPGLPRIRRAGAARPGARRRPAAQRPVGLRQSSRLPLAVLLVVAHPSNLVRLSVRFHVWSTSPR